MTSSAPAWGTDLGPTGDRPASGAGRPAGAGRAAGGDEGAAAHQPVADGPAPAAGAVQGGGRDRCDAALVLGAPGMLAAFNQAGVLGPADVHVAMRLAKLGGDGDELVALAAALAVRAPRYGHVHVELATVAGTATADVEEAVDVGELPWPDLTGWIGRLAASPLVAVGEDSPRQRPLRLVGTALYLDRYWRDERAVAADLAARAGAAGPEVDEAVLADGLGRLLPGPVDEQRWAAAAVVMRRLSVVAGGPGTGKTTTVSRVLALLHEQARATGGPPPLVALAAPTGKAAARLQEAVHAEAKTLAVAGPVRSQLLGVGAATIHRLLAPRPDNASRFRHHRHNRLPHDVVVVDETSMVSLSLMARLAEAVRPDARLVLVGDPEQLASIEAGAVLGDIVGPVAGGLRMRPAAAAALGRVTGVAPSVAHPPPEVAVGDGMVVLRSSYRFGGALAELAAAIADGDEDRAVGVLSRGDPGLSWLPIDVATAGMSALGPARDTILGSATRLYEAARAGDGEGALDALDRSRALCAHRQGPAGATTWSARVEEWLSAQIEGFSPDGPWYVGRPVLVTANDYGLRLFNGDAGVVVAGRGGGVEVAFRHGGSVSAVSPARLAGVETLFAMTVHKAQGSEFEEVALLLPAPDSGVLTRQLLYTAVTRARRRVVVVGTEASVRAAVGRPVTRASELTRRLWGPAPSGAGPGGAQVSGSS